MRSIVAVVGSLFMVWAAGAEAQAAADDEVIITGQRLEETLPQQLGAYGTKVDTLTSAQVQNGGYIDIAGALQALAPGLYISPKNGPFDYVDISLQGSRSKDVLWLVDGVRINNRLYGGTTPLDTMPSSIIERIEILNGGQALFYGTQAVAGAINIVTKAFTGEPDGAFSLGGDTNGGRHLDAYFRDGLGKHQFVIYGSSDQSVGYQPYRDQDYQPSTTDRNRAYNVLTVGLKYAYEFSDRLRLSTLYQHTDGKLDFASPMFTATSFNDRDENLLSAKLDYTLSDSVQLFAKTYGHWWYSHFTEFDNVIGSPGTLEVSADHDFWGYKEYGANLMAKFASRHGLEYVIGYDNQNYSGSDAELVIAEKSEQVNAVFAQVRTTPELLSQASFAAGVRYDSPSFGESAAVWNLGGQYKFSDGLYARATVGTSFRLPTAEELFADDPNDERGNPNLQAEQGRNLNLSLGGQLTGAAIPLHWEITGFFRDIDHLIVLDGFDPLTNQDLFENVTGTVAVRGFQLDLQAAFSNAFSGNLSATYNRSRMQGTDLQVTRIPVHLYKAMLDFHPTTRPIGASLTVNHVGAVYASVWDGREAFGNYTVVDLAGRVYLDQPHRHTISVRLENLLDKEYATLLGSAVRDSDGSDYTYWNLGVPRTLSVRYSYRF